MKCKMFLSFFLFFICSFSVLKSDNSYDINNSSRGFLNRTKSGIILSGDDGRMKPGGGPRVPVAVAIALSVDPAA